MAVTSSFFHCQRLATAVSAPQASPSKPPQLPRIQALFPDTTWKQMPSLITLPPPQPMVSLPPLLVANHSPSPPTYPYRKCMLDVCITPTKTIVKRLEIPPTKARKPLSLFDLLSADTALSSSVPTEPAAVPERKVVGRPAVLHRRQCGVPECLKYALSGGFCIRHGGGKRCSSDGCLTVAQSGGLCKAHGGGSRCRVALCSNVARRKGFCMSHGGRQPCKVDGCAKCAHGGGFCISHGGGKRCAAPECLKSAQAGGFCYSHGGGKRCSSSQCFQAARKGGLCIRHRKASA
ncbi:hypothetical protein PybrP1_009822 [[Pythium] brassicae (nom. inval.)]|nr:hypothetical protein PybrP1_009822 [[Pythium] brassicae (nom. inval.)]